MCDLESNPTEALQAYGYQYKMVYICHPYSDDPIRNEGEIWDICRSIFADNQEKIEKRKKGVNQFFGMCEKDITINIPITPILYFPSPVADTTVDHELLLDFSGQVLDTCAEIWVYGDVVTADMKKLIEYAIAANIPLFWK